MFYAEYCPYGTDTISDCNALLRFATKAERDDAVERINDGSDNDLAIAVTTRSIAHCYNVNDFSNPDIAYRFDLCEIDTTCSGNEIYAIPYKSNYMY